MDMDNEVESAEVDEEEKEKFRRPSSSYGSMKSDTEEEEEEVAEENVEMEEMDKQGGEEEAAALPEPGPAPHQGTGILLIGAESVGGETLYTMTTDQTKPPGALVIDTRSCDLDDFPDDDDIDDEDEDEERSTVNSPEPPEPVEPDDVMTEENRRLGVVHPEQDLPHVFRTVQNVLTGLENDDLRAFKYSFYQWEQKISLKQLMEGDILDFVDRIFEVLGQERSVCHTVRTLENIGKSEEAAELQNQCKRALIRFHLQQYLIRKHHVIREGVVQAGKQNILNTVYVAPQISTCGYGGVNPSHEIRRHHQESLQVPNPDTFVGLNDLFRLQKDDGSPVRTVLTTGIPGIGMSVSVGKFSLDWAERRANRDMQFVIKLSFRALWLLRSKNLPPEKMMSIMEVIEYYHPECKGMHYLEEDGCKFLIIMDSFDCYQAPLDWENAPIINDIRTRAHPDVLIVNILRGSVLPGGNIWILGRRAAVSQIPSKFIDAVTEIQGFSDEMKNEFLTRRFDAHLAAKITSHYKRLPTLVTLAHQPFVCWMLATVFERSFRYEDYGAYPPRLTPFYISIMIIQMNRRLQFYYAKAENQLKWSNEDKLLLHQMGKMAFKMLERNVSVFFEEDLKENGLNLTEVVVFSGLCTELPSTVSDKRRKFCFIHLTYQEFMAALYVLTMLRTEAKNVLDSGVMPRILMSGYQTKSAASLIQCALTRTLNHPLGQYDMFLRFLCGLLAPDCHDRQLKGFLYPHNMPKLGGLDEVERLLEQTIQTAAVDRVGNLRECLREMTQTDE